MYLILSSLDVDYPSLSYLEQFGVGQAENRTGRAGRGRDEDLQSRLGLASLHERAAPRERIVEGVAHRPRPG